MTDSSRLVGKRNAPMTAGPASKEHVSGVESTPGARRRAAAGTPGQAFPLQHPDASERSVSRPFRSVSRAGATGGPAEGMSRASEAAAHVPGNYDALLTPPIASPWHPHCLSPPWWILAMRWRRAVRLLAKSPASQLTEAADAGEACWPRIPSSRGAGCGQLLRSAPRSEDARSRRAQAINRSTVSRAIG
ncbi:MAG: hypothetical protein KatS3mg111_2407 [Pirellulaceae bacterium]|nr:MAG: hypothetical protein KatS3mg111_2407 [Pirellulaceae bacterium]